jgi:AcrR family transcriptional regulator
MAAKQQPLEKPVRGRGRPKLEDVAAIEDRLLAIALAEFSAHGYGGTSMARIVKAARVSKTTLYSRYPSKEDLFRAIIRDQIDRLSASAALRLRSGSPDLVRGLNSYANRALEFSLTGEMLEVNRLIYGESPRFPELGMAAAEATELGVQHISDFIRQCAEADGLPCRDPRAVAEAFIFLLRGWYANMMLTNRLPPRSQREKWIARAIETLIAGRKDW